MSVVPLYLRMLDDLTPTSIFDQDFGLGLLHEDLYHPRVNRGVASLRPSRQGYLRPWTQPDSASSSLVNTKDEFKVNLDVQQFKPEEISVKVVDNYIVIDGRHEERQDEHGYITREFKRRYLLPQDVDPKAVSSSLSSDGVLSVSAPKKQKLLLENEVKIPIVQTSKPAISSKSQKSEAKDKADSMEQ